MTGEAVTTPPLGVGRAGREGGFIGLPAEGATPSPPLDTPIVVSIVPCYAPIGDPAESTRCRRWARSGSSATDG